MKWVQTKRKEFTYLDKILYDEFEQRSYIRYGNGAETSYTYKPDNRLLNNLKVNSGGIQMMNNTYSYDSLQNITQVLNNGSTANTIGGGISYNYHYDKLNRLDSASGEFTGYNGKKAKYTLSMSYDNMHNITRKKQDMVQSRLKFTGMLHAGEELNYTINAENCQQIRNIAQSSYRQASPATAAYQTGIPGGVELKQKTEEYGYDANGNLLYVNGGIQTSDSTMQVNQTRKMLWDEENRLQAVSDNGFVSNYYYDASGERTVKLSGASQGVFVNGALNSATTQTNRFTAYISPYLVLNSGGYYSKHIYAGTQRIVSKLGSSEIFHSAPTFSALPAGKLTGLTATVKARYDSLGVAYHGSPQGTNGFETSASGKINTPQLYFYHPDHLGSSSLITDNNGLLVQHLQYLPFGEVFIDERKGSWHTPFTFSAKEQDEETGLHYFSARYYDSHTSVWLSVDPLAEKYPNVSSYVYCANNPVNHVDPDGKQFFSPLLGVSDILMSQKPIVNETMSKIGRTTTETASKIEDHHVIPRALKDNSVVKEARNEGFKFDGKENKISVDKFSKQTGEGQHGNHPSFTKEIQHKLSDFQKENPNFTGKDAVSAVRNIVKDVKQTIQNNPNTKINDLYKAPTDNIKSFVPIIVKPQKKQ